MVGLILVRLDGSAAAEAARAVAKLIPSHSVRLLAVEPMTAVCGGRRNHRNEGAHP
jgi:hypothetical protein